MTTTKETANADASSCDPSPIFERQKVSRQRDFTVWRGRARNLERLGSLLYFPPPLLTLSSIPPLLSLPSRPPVCNLVGVESCWVKNVLGLSATQPLWRASLNASREG